MEMHTLFKCWLHKYTKVIPKTKAKYLGRTCILLDKDGKSTSSNCTYWQRYTRTLFLHIPLSLSAEVHSMDLHIGQTSNYKPLAQSIPSYIKSSFDFVKKIQLQQATMCFPTTALLFTCDAVAIYSNINTEALNDIKPCTPGDVLKALELIMQRNTFQFSDTYWHQKQGTAMGTPPACMWATLFFARHK